jgi:release factor glutamine methyltransferase
LPRTLKDILDRNRGKLPAVDLYYLLAHAIGRNREFILAHPEYRLGIGPLCRWRRMKRRRLRGIPAAYLTGEKEFYGLVFKVNRHTLIPRPETELIVDEVVRHKPESLLDLGTGSGCIALAVARHLPLCKITAVDMSKKALVVAALNSSRLGISGITFKRSDYFSSLPSQHFDIIASNPPYVREGDVERLSPEVAAHEPSVALYGGRDGLHAYRIILNNARDFLVPGGVLVLEISPEIASALQQLAGFYAYSIDRLARDLSGYERMMVLSPE